MTILLHSLKHFPHVNTVWVYDFFILDLQINAIQVITKHKMNSMWWNNIIYLVVDLVKIEIDQFFVVYVVTFCKIYHWLCDLNTYKIEWIVHDNERP